MKCAPKILALLLASSLVGIPERPQAVEAGQSTDLAAIAARVAQLRQEVEAAEAVRDVKRLQWAYGHYSEFGLWYDFADLFADTGVGHYVQGDLDRDGIRKLFFDEVGQGRLGLADGRIYPHISFSPVVTLDPDGKHAKARFRILAMLGGYGGNATWFHGLYENAYVVEDGVWKVNELSNTAQVTGNFTAGLTPSPMTPGQSALAFHYGPREVGSTALPADMDHETAGSADLLTLVREVMDLRQRAQNLADEAAIVRLQDQYADALDNHDVDALVALFADDATYEWGQQGVYVGKSSIGRALGLPGPLSSGAFDEHMLFQTYVSIAPDGNSAFARVDQIGMEGTAGNARWTQGIYENAFVKQDGEWRIKALHYYPRVITDYDKGWGADAQPLPPVSTLAPPDAPPSEVYGIYPAFHIPAFHFLHPVTGARPQYPEGDPAAERTAGFPVSPPIPARPPSDAQAVLREVAQLEESVARSRSVDAVENLVNAYAYYTDECMVEEAAQLFVSANAEGAQPDGCAGGRQEGDFTVHHSLQPIITLSADGQHATIAAKLWQVHATMVGEDGYASGKLEGEAVRQGAQWLLASLSVHASGWPPPPGSR